MIFRMCICNGNTVATEKEEVDKARKGNIFTSGRKQTRAPVYDTASEQVFENERKTYPLIF